MDLGGGSGVCRGLKKDYEGGSGVCRGGPPPGGGPGTPPGGGSGGVKMVDF